MVHDKQFKKLYSKNTIIHTSTCTCIYILTFTVFKHQSMMYKSLINLPDQSVDVETSVNI